MCKLESVTLRKERARKREKEALAAFAESCARATVPRCLDRRCRVRGVLARPRAKSYILSSLPCIVHACVRQPIPGNSSILLAISRTSSSSSSSLESGGSTRTAQVSSSTHQCLSCVRVFDNTRVVIVNNTLTKDKRKTLLIELRKDMLSHWDDGGGSYSSSTA